MALRVFTHADMTAESNCDISTRPGFLDRTGQKRNMLRVISFAHQTNGRNYWNCLCDCGALKILAWVEISKGKVKSCGCFQDTFPRVQFRTHGKSSFVEYRIWAGMKHRCLDTKCREYKRYGGRGIKFCSRWESFEKFLSDMGKRPTPEHSLDRIDNDGNYEPSNCRWGTRHQQANNRSNNVRLTLDGVTDSLMNWSRKLGIKHGTLRQRLSRGMSPEEAMK